MSAILKDWQDYPSGTAKRHLYLASREWAVLKEAVKARSKGTCERCRNAPGENVHHKTYERIYQERLEDLVHLCRPCHEFVSGKRTRDPLLDVPVTFRGKHIQSVYLAGKITGDKWRDQIAPGWSVENDGLMTYEIAECGYWDTIKSCLPLPDGRKLHLTGPFWKDLSETGGHSTMPEPRHDIVHAYGDAVSWDALGCHGAPDEVTGASTDKETLLGWICLSIDFSDLVFAWVDSLDCFGTLAEIGFAKGRMKSVYHDLGDGDRYEERVVRAVIIAHPPGFTPSDLWLAFQMADLVIEAASPAEAWSKLWAGGTNQ